MNSLLNQPFQTPFQTPPFTQFRLHEYLPAIVEAAKEARRGISEIVENPSNPDFYNTIEALTLNGEKLERISAVFFNLNSADTNDEMQELAREISPVLTDFANDILLNEELFKKVKLVYEAKESLRLNAEEKELLRRTFKNFSRNGALLTTENKEKLREIDKKLASLKLQFGQNLLAETNAYELHLTNEEDLSGVPEHIKETAAEDAEYRDKTGWIFTLQMPSYSAFMKFADNRELRKKLYLANGAKASQNNEFDNTEIIKEIVRLRYQRAQLLGYETHADFVLEERMAESSVKVKSFLENLRLKSLPQASEEVKILGEFAKKVNDITELMPWDHAYYAEKVKKEKFDLSDEELKPYFELNQVLKGAFEIAARLFGIRFILNNQYEIYHPDVKVYDVINQDQQITGILYTDFFPRSGKRNGAWMTSFRNSSMQNGVHKIPQISIVCNFTKPTKETPSLLTFNEVTTLFHEFGHALHGLLANTRYESLSGTNVFWDFVELPSQFMENYCFEPEALQIFARHYQTGEIIPESLIEKIKASSQFMEAYQTLRQVSFGMLDMAWHSINPVTIQDVKAFEKKAFEGTQLYPEIHETNMSTSFSHIFQGGYASGYYSYKWAEVLDADAFDFFRQNGIFDPITAKKFHYLLSSGGTIHPMTLYKDFRGKEPDPAALLRRAGLVAAENQK